MMNSCRRVLPIVSVAAACLLLVATARAERMKLTVDGESREALVFPPSKKDPAGKAPVILAFHGRGGNMQETSQGMRFEAAWPEAIVVYMQGTPLDSSPDGYFWRYPGQPFADRDLDFCDHVLAALSAKFSVDVRRIYAAGFSNGAAFSYVLWGARPNTFAAFGIVAGLIPPGVHLTVAKPAVVIGGDHDQTVKFPTQLAAMQAARAVDGAGDTGTPCGPQCTLYSASKGAPVVTYIHGGDHIFPGDAASHIVKFFKQHALAP